MPKARKTGKKSNVVRLERVKKRRRSRALFAILSVLVVALGGLAIMEQMRKISAQQQRIDEIRAQIADAAHQKQLLQIQLDYMTTDEYIESVAREKLGLLKDNEILFVTRSDRSDETGDE